MNQSYLIFTPRWIETILPTALSAPPQSQHQIPFHEELRSRMPAAAAALTSSVN
jgi:hypothetical protein